MRKIKELLSKSSYWDFIFIAAFIILSSLCWDFYKGFNNIDLNFIGLLVEMTVGFFIVEVIDMVKSGNRANMIIGILTLVACFFALAISTSSIVSSYMNSSANIEANKKKEVSNPAYEILVKQETEQSNSLTRLNAEKKALEDGKQPAIDEEPTDHLTDRATIRKEYDNNIKLKQAEISQKDTQLNGTREKMKITPKTKTEVSDQVTGNEIFLKTVSKIFKTNVDTTMLIIAVILALTVQVFYFASKYNAKMARKKKSGKIDYSIDYVVRTFQEKQNRYMIEALSKQLNGMGNVSVSEIMTDQTQSLQPAKISLEKKSPSLITAKNNNSISDNTTAGKQTLERGKSEFYPDEKADTSTLPLPTKNKIGFTPNTEKQIDEEKEINLKPDIMRYLEYMFKYIKDDNYSPGKRDIKTATGLQYRTIDLIWEQLEKVKIIKVEEVKGVKKSKILKSKDDAMKLINKYF